MTMGDFVEMGLIGRPHGLAGEVSLRWAGEVPVPLKGEIFLDAAAGKLKPFVINSLRMHKGFPLVSLEGIVNREAAEALRGAKVYMARASLPPPKEGEVWLEDLIGSAILLEDGRFLGRLHHLEFPAGQQIWAIQAEDGQEILFPARPEFIENIDTEKGEVKITPPPGLLDIYLA